MLGRIVAPLVRAYRCNRSINDSFVTKLGVTIIVVSIAPFKEVIRASDTSSAVLWSPFLEICLRNRISQNARKRRLWTDIWYSFDCVQKQDLCKQINEDAYPLRLGHTWSRASNHFCCKLLRPLGLLPLAQYQSLRTHRLSCIAPSNVADILNAWAQIISLQRRYKYNIVLSGPGVNLTYVLRIPDCIIWTSANSPHLINKEDQRDYPKNRWEALQSVTRHCVQWLIPSGHYWMIGG